jgi:DNA-binding transcriptional MerR regulator
MADVDERLTTSQVAELVRVSYRQLDHWSAFGYLPIAHGQPGTGKPRAFSPAEVELVRVFAVLVHSGVQPSVICEALPSLTRRGRSFSIKLGDLIVRGRLP